MIICISVKAWATVQSFWMVINLYKITRDLEWPMTSDVGIPMASYHNHPEDSCTVFHKLSHETIQPLGYHDNRNPNGWWNASSYDQWPSYETPGGMDLPWHGHFFLSDTAAVFTAAVLTWFKESRENAETHMAERPDENCLKPNMGERNIVNYIFLKK